ncbi:MAG: ABC transporter permease DevC [Pirellulaceae bacterium]
MRTSLARANLVHNKVRTLVAIAGVAFAVVLIFMQLGFIGALETTANLIYNALRFDICIRSKDYVHFSQAGTFPMRRLHQAASVAGVQRLCPFYAELNLWRIPPGSKYAGQKRGVLTMGIRPRDPVFRLQELQNQATLRLVEPDRMLIDRETRRDFGPRNGRRFGDQDVAAGVETEIGDKRVRIVGHFSMGAGFAANGSIIMNDRGFARVTATRTENDVTLGLIQLDPGAPIARTASALRRILPDDVEVLTRPQVLSQEKNYWVWQTTYGFIFQTGVVIALVVGTVIVYQVLSSDVANLLPEYATLKALGYRDRYLAGVVLKQALALSILGFIPGLLISLLLYYITSSLANIPIRMTWFNFLFVLALSTMMCTISGLGAMRKTFTADPADLF